MPGPPSHGMHTHFPKIPHITKISESCPPRFHTPSLDASTSQTKIPYTSPATLTPYNKSLLALHPSPLGATSTQRPQGWHQRGASLDSVPLVSLGASTVFLHPRIPTHPSMGSGVVTFRQQSFRPQTPPAEWEALLPSIDPSDNFPCVASSRSGQRSDAQPSPAPASVPNGAFSSSAFRRTPTKKGPAAVRPRLAAGPECSAGR